MHSLTNAPETTEVYADPAAPPNASPEASIDAIRVIRHLGLDEPGGVIQVQTARLTTPGQKSRWFEPGEGWFGHDLPDQIERAWAYAARQDSMIDSSGAGREAFICVHRLINPRYGRKKENAAPIRTLWSDIDGGDVDKLRPTALIETSPGRYQGYWRLDRWIAPHAAEDLNKRIAAYIGGDNSGHDLTQVLRLPGLHNWSRPGYPLVKLIYIDDGDAGR